MRQSPLRELHEAFVRESAAAKAGHDASARPGAAVGHQVAAAVEYVPYGLGEDDQKAPCEIVADFGQVELEYAAIRRGAGVMDCPQRGTLMVTGEAKDRRDLLNRLVTQELKDLQSGIVREAFWLNRKGRIDADLLLIELGGRMFIDVDCLQAASAARTLGEFIFAEDVEIADVSEAHHHIAMHGRHALDALTKAADEQIEPLEVGRGCVVKIGGVEVVAARRDQTGEPGVELIMEREKAAIVWATLLDVRRDSKASEFPIRPLGWNAFNIARIEAGTPLMNIDFGTTNLPHETSILDRRVSFKKGCYLGQEVVARMQSLGRPKQVLVGLRILADVLPECGSQVFAANDDGTMGDQVGVVTSSTLSPMLGAAPVAFAMLRTAASDAGTRVLVSGEGSQAPATVGALQFLPAEK